MSAPGDVPFGDVLIAGTAVGVFSDLTQTIKELIPVKEVIEPVPEWEAVYDKLYPYYLDMYQHLDADYAVSVPLLITYRSRQEFQAASSRNNPAL